MNALLTVDLNQNPKTKKEVTSAQRDEFDDAMEEQGWKRAPGVSTTYFRKFSGRERDPGGVDTAARRSSRRPG
jgi:hypothetical protein